MARKRKGKSRKRAGQKQLNEPEDVKRAPHSFVLCRGQVGKHVSELMKNFRKVMEPYTASKLKVLRTNALKDFVSISGVLNVTHMVMFTKSSIGVYMRIIRLPHGPTLTFRVMNYSVARDVISSLKKPLLYAKQFDHHPLIVLNNFSGEGPHMKLMATTFQNLFPSINIHKVKLNSIRRCVLMNYNSEDSTIDFRHYSIKVVPTGISKGVKKLIQNKVPNLGKFTEISDFMINCGNLSESEVELDGPANQVTLPQKVSSRGNAIAEQSAIRLVELGPRIKLCLIKIEDGILNGEVLYHKHIKKTPEEIEIIRKNILRKRKLKEQRQKQQQENVKQKAERKEKNAQQDDENKMEGESEHAVGDGDNNNNDDDDDDDAVWFQKETGIEPDKDLFSKNKKRPKQSREFDGGKRKKFKLNNGSESVNFKDKSKKQNFELKKKNKGKEFDKRKGPNKKARKVVQPGRRKSVSGRGVSKRRRK